MPPHPTSSSSSSAPTMPQTNAPPPPLPPRQQLQEPSQELSEGFMLYSGFMDDQGVNGVKYGQPSSARPPTTATTQSTPKPRRTPKELNLSHSTPTQGDYPTNKNDHNNDDNMVHASTPSGSRRLSYDDLSPFDDLPLGKVNPVGIQDEMDEVVYGYALKIAYINRMLQKSTAAAAAANKTRSPTPHSQSYNLASPALLSTSPVPQHQQPTSSYFPQNPRAISPAAGLPTTSPGGSGSLGRSTTSMFGRKKSGSTGVVGAGESGRAGGKLPKEFLPGFWDVLGNEGGDAIWRSSVNTFLSYLPNKKATKTSSGMNLREISTLLETFSSVLPSVEGGMTSPKPASAAHTANPHKHIHVTHLIALLSTALQGFYNPMNRKLKDEDREMHLRIMNELDSWTLRPDPQESRSQSQSIYGDPMGGEPGLGSSPNAKSVSRKSSFLSGMNRKRGEMGTPPPLPSPTPGAGTPSFASSSSTSLISDGSLDTPLLSPGERSPSRGSLGGHEARRKSSAGGRGETRSEVNLIDVVRRVFGVDTDRLNHDLDGLRRAGLDEKCYLSDLKLHLINANADTKSKDSPSMQDRIKSLQAELSALVHARPDLAGLQTPLSRTQSNGPGPTTNGSDFFFTPNTRKDEIYSRLVWQARYTLGYDTALLPKTTGERELIELCAGVWGIQNKSIAEVAVSFGIWSDCVNSDSEDDEVVGSRFTLGKSPARKRASYTEEFGWAERVLEDLLDLAMDIELGLEPDGQALAKSTLITLHNKLAGHVTSAVASIYPTTAIPPNKPPPSSFSLIKALLDSPDLSALLPDSLKNTFWQDAADDLRGAAVGEYVVKQVELLEGGNDAGLMSGDATTKSLEGYERLSDFIEDGVRRVGKVWPQDRLDGRLFPPAVILSKQLPLFLAELQFLDQPSSGTKADVIFGLYERTARLIHLWEELCPGEQLAFELDAFFEPHVREWLKGTNEVDTHEWVSRAVGMDSWVPEGSLRHSQSVLDLFQFIRTAVTTILVDLPLGEYNRACYLIDFSRTAASSVTQYATTVESLFMAEMQPKQGNSTIPVEPPASSVGGKAGAWLAKSKQAIQSLERKKVEGFNIPPTACVKLTDMGAARACLEDLSIAMEADESARIVKEHTLKTNGLSSPSGRSTQHVFTITASRGENLLSRNLSKAADAFVSVTDPALGHRLFKSNTALGRVDPTWEEAFELTIAGAKTLDLACYDRTLVGKHDLIGTATFKLDPSAHREQPSREILVPLHPRGRVYLRLDMEGGEKHEVKFHLDRAGRALDRAGQAMTRCIVDRMGDFIKSQISKEAVRDLLKPLSAKIKKGGSKQTSLAEEDFERSLIPLFDYFDSNFSTFAVTLSDRLKIHVMTQLWKRVVDTLISILIPPLSDKETTADPLSSQEINVVFQWLKLLKSFFNACENGVEYGVPLLTLQSGAYKDLLLIGQYLDLPVAGLKEKCIAAIKGVGRQSSKSQNLAQSGFTAPGASDDEERTAEILLRILRMRPGTSDFLQTQIGTLNDARVRKQTMAQ